MHSISYLFVFKKMDNNFKFKTRHVSIVQRSSPVVNSFTSSVELIPAMAYKLKRDTIPNSKNLTYNLKNLMYRIILNFAKSCISSFLSKFYNKKKFYCAVFEI